MNCSCCNIEIPPAWVAVIAKNECPSCSGKIMSDGTIDLMNGLKEALEKMPNDPQGIAGWLLSNYQMRKIGTGEPTEFIGVKPKTGSGQPTSEGIKLAGTPLERFQKLAGIKVEPPEKYKALISEINSGVLDGEQDEPVINSRNDENYVAEADDPEYTKQMLKTMMTPAGAKNKIRQSVKPDYDEEDLSDLHPSLHQDRLIRLAKQRELDMGGIGKIKRG